MVGKIGMARQARGVALAATAALLLTSGAALAQLNGMNGGSPLLGVPGNAAPAVGGTGIPFGSTELGAGGLSPMPLGATSGLAPFGSSMTGTTTIGGIGATGTTMPGIAGLTSSLGNGLGPRHGHLALNEFEAAQGGRCQCAAGQRSFYPFWLSPLWRQAALLRSRGALALLPRRHPPLCPPPCRWWPRR